MSLRRRCPTPPTSTPLKIYRRLELDQVDKTDGSDRPAGGWRASARLIGPYALYGIETAASLLPYSRALLCLPFPPSLLFFFSFSLWHPPATSFEPSEQIVVLLPPAFSVLSFLSRPSQICQDGGENLHHLQRCKSAPQQPTFPLACATSPAQAPPALLRSSSVQGQKDLQHSRACSFRGFLAFADHFPPSPSLQHPARLCFPCERSHGDMAHRSTSSARRRLLRCWSPSSRSS